jgi:phenylacetate-CoA ligase
MIWDKKAECMSIDELRLVQTERLKDTVKRVYNSVPHYRNKFNELGVTPEDITSVDDLSKLPFTVKNDLRDNYPFGMFAVPLSEIVRIHASSGTTGKQTVVGYTRKDIDTWSEIMARALYCGGTEKNSIIQIAYGYGLFTGGLGAHYGAERIGASVVPISGGNTKRQITIMEDFGTTVLACTPSYAMHIAEVLEEGKIDKSKIKLKHGIFGAEPWSDNMRRELENKLGITALDIYGLSEIMGPGVAVECPAKQGLHIFEDHFIPEIIDPDTGELLPYGEEGELVITTITKEGIPVIRYRTKDITSLSPEQCSCGRTHVRMRKITGRTDDMIIIRGVNVFPTQIETVLLDIAGVQPFYQLRVNRIGTMDELEVLVEVSFDLISSGVVRSLELLERKIYRELESLLGISVKVRLVEPKTIERTDGKAKRVIDNRKL